MKLLYFFFVLFFYISCSIETKKKEISDNNDFNRLLKQADMFYKKNDFNSALDLYQKVAFIDSMQPIAYYRIGYCYSQLLDIDMANKFYQKSIFLNYRVEDAPIGASFQTCA